MTVSEARYEFRVWGDKPDDCVAALRASSDRPDWYEGEETYLIAPGIFDVNPKLRYGLLDVKVLLDVAEGCERWRPWIKTEVPVAAATIREQFLPRLGISPPVLRRTAYTGEELIAEVAIGLSIEPVAVSKRRERFDIGDCSAEYAVVMMRGRRLHTVAIESADLGALVNLRLELGLESHANVSYPRLIAEVIAGEWG